MHADPERPESLARQLLAVLDEPQLGARLADSGRTRARRDFDWRVISRRLASLYQELSGSKRAER